MQTQIFGFDFQKSFDYENGFYITSQPSRLAKGIAHYELYKKIISLPGDVVECGVFKGTSLIRFATYREMLESQTSRKIWGFDAFGEFPKEVSMDEDMEFIKNFEESAGNGISISELSEVFSKKGISNINLVKGNILKTLPEFAKNYAQRIALLHIDVDVYEATYAVLENLYDKVVCGGIIIFDDYGMVSGATKAIEDFFSERICKKEKELTLQKLSYNYIPCYMVK